MSNNISAQLLAQFYGQSSDDPLLTLLTITHPSITTVRLVNNTVDIVSRGNTYTALPFKIRPPSDDGESRREAELTLDNITLDLIDELRTVTSPMEVTMELVLASMLDTVQLSYEELKIRNISYNKDSIRASLYMDDFLNTEMTSEKYSPSLYPGLY